MRGKAKLAGFQFGLELLDAALQDGPFDTEREVRQPKRE
jgi:hypothetical protein